MNFILISLHTIIAIVSIRLNGFNYCNLTLIILININNLFAHSEVVSTIAIKNKIVYSTLFCTQLNDSKFCNVS